MRGLEIQLMSMHVTHRGPRRLRDGRPIQGFVGRDVPAPHGVARLLRTAPGGAPGIDSHVGAATVPGHVGHEPITRGGGILLRAILLVNA